MEEKESAIQSLNNKEVELELQMKREKKYHEKKISQILMNTKLIFKESIVDEYLSLKGEAWERDFLVT